MNKNKFLHVASIIAANLFLMSRLSQAAPQPSGQVVSLEGKVKKTSPDGKAWVVHKGNAVYEGDVFETELASTLHIVFRDKSELTLGPTSKIKIDEYVNNEPGLISLLFGQLRSKVSKSINGNVKLLLKTPSSVMGVRGTDFHVVFNQQKQMTLLVTYEGAVAMTSGDRNSAKTSELINSFQNQSRTVLVERGQFSGISPGLENPTVPVKISPVQLDSLKSGALVEKSKQSSPRASSQDPKQKIISVVPPGLNPKVVAESVGDINAALQKSDKNLKFDGSTSSSLSHDTAANPPEGLVDRKSGRTVPPAGGFIDFKAGLYIPPPPGSSYDAVAGVYVPPAIVSGSFHPETGAYMAANDGAVPIPQNGSRPQAVVTNTVPGILPGLQPEAMGQGMVAAPLEGGANMSESLARPLAFQPLGARYHEGGLFGVLPPPPGSQYPSYDGVQPRVPVYDPSVCPPYCDPRYQPGLYPAMPYRQPFSAVTVIISV